MIQELLQISVIGVLVSIFALVIRRNNGEIAVLLGLACCVTVFFFFLKLFTPVRDYIRKLADLSRLESELLTPLLKSVAVGLLTQFTGSICLDAGQGAVAKMIELCGCILCLYLSLPLLDAVLELMQTLGAGG